MARTAAIVLLGVLLSIPSGMPAASAQTGAPFGGFKHDSSAPIQIVSNTLDVQQAQGKAIFSGKVVAEQGTLKLTADKLTVFYDSGQSASGTSSSAGTGSSSASTGSSSASTGNSANTGSSTGTGKIKDMRAEGNVFLSNGSETAKGKWAEYDVAGGMMRMGGGVVLTQGKNAISGEQLVINLDAGTGHVEGSKGGRVKSVFTPSKATNSTATPSKATNSAGTKAQ